MEKIDKIIQEIGELSVLEQPIFFKKFLYEHYINISTNNIECAKILNKFLNDTFVNTKPEDGVLEGIAHILDEIISIQIDNAEEHEDLLDV